MEKLNDIITIGEKYGPAMKIRDKAEADAYFELLVEHNMRVGLHDREEAEKIEKGNLGYYAGYYDAETRARVEKLFNCEHPVFGPISKGEPTAAEAFGMGIKAGEKVGKR